ncbi:Kinesin-like Protein [Chondrus crispus]|uniref:Kinesin-like protein n=1 Tax=Chondrus crispus TaxID=2769 RepID=R7Q473_CHOCR|nr:Kinesin-like Protein [Chondrus crispus]CDF32275.1 Kinesin-like Protein [Chondrus crispus]|eukprot:XP_005711940.1 Kinesin-like Protein [Chondrus crispus]
MPLTTNAASAKTEPLVDPDVKPSHSSGSAIRVVLRVRPLSELEKKHSPVSSVTRNLKNECTVHIRPANPKKHPVAVRNAGRATFKFAHIFDEASSQSNIFEQTTLPMIAGLFNGQSAVVFAHGVTCSGKTWTIQGCDEHPGILPRSLDNKMHDSNYIEVSGDIEYKIFASYLEVYNEQCYDLFEKAKRKILKLKMNRDREVYPEGITEIEIRNCADIDRLLEFGQQNRSVAHTKANEVSSRSHAVFFITLKMSETLKGPSGHPRTRHRTSKLSIVDLAGSERTGRTNNAGNGVRQTETNKINSSLMNLGRCLQVMRRNQRTQKTDPLRKLEIVPFRHSRLTHLLQNCLEAGSAVMIANVSPTMTDSDETIQALRCAAIAQEVTLVPNRKMNVLKDRTNNMNQLLIRPAPAPSKRIRGSTKKGASRNLRQNDLTKQDPAFVTIPKSEYEEMTSSIATMKKEITFSRMENEEEKCNNLENERRIAQMTEEMDMLFRDKERLIDRLADSEARLCVVETEIREEMAEGTEQLLKQVHDAYEKQLNEVLRERDDLGDTGESFSSEGYRRVSKVHTEGKEQAEAMAARLARRASKAAFESVRFPLADPQQEIGDEVESTGEWETEGDEYIEADDGGTGKHPRMYPVLDGFYSWGIN